ncbi:hypothetical protein [Streptomyces sp. R35]|uniref:4Fe-4S Wbl-type domain-containing protein n=1 Tax=Streptomyces sp. R35 TaxID=3238630 RepID=A0AB39S9D2_9ACTN
MSSPWWVREAPCGGDGRFTPDDVSEDTLRAAQTQQLLQVCQQCPFRSACISLVLPRRSKFDGICGGRLWLNGEIRATCENADPAELAEPTSPITHGTEAGARAHNRRGETACSLCREAARLAQAARRAKRRAPHTQKIGDIIATDIEDRGK